MRRLELRALPGLLTVRLDCPLLSEFAAADCDALLASGLAAAIRGRHTPGALRGKGGRGRGAQGVGVQ
jgi:hypothetical protein